MVSEQRALDDQNPGGSADLAIDTASFCFVIFGKSHQIVTVNTNIGYSLLPSANNLPTHPKQ